MRKLVWLDMEMTGLDPVDDQILEIAAIITDNDLNIVEEFNPITIGHVGSELKFNFGENEEELLESFNKSGLLKRVENSELNVSDAEKLLLQNIKKHCIKKRCHLAGSSIWTDARFLIHQMPSVWEFMHYKLLDVTSIKLLRQEWYPEIEEYEKADTHDALTDIKESIEQLKYYRKVIFK